MKIQLPSNYTDTINLLKTKAFTLKASCDAMVDVPKPKEKRLDELEDFFEELYETLYKYTPKISVNQMKRKGVFVDTLEQLEVHFDESMKVLEQLTLDSRKRGDLAAELLFIGLYEQGLFPKDKDE